MSGRGVAPELSPNAFSDDSFHSLRWRYRDSPRRGPGVGRAMLRAASVKDALRVQQVLSRRWAPSAVLRAGLTLGPALRLLLFRLPPLLPQRIHRQSNSENVAYPTQRAGHVPVRSALDPEESCRPQVLNPAGPCASDFPNVFNCGILFFFFFLKKNLFISLGPFREAG